MFILCSKCGRFFIPFFIGVRFIGIKLAVVRTLVLQSVLSSKNFRFWMTGVSSDKRHYCSGENLLFI